MALQAVYMPPDVYYACTLHALTVEKEEIMGLLIGKFDSEENARISSIIVLQRSDKRKDRVEISTEQLHAAIEKTTELSEALGESLNIVGWYHSHPHITVQPSHVDLRTQASYQMLDRRFVGIIFSVFNEDRSKTHEIQVTCFQSVGSNGNYKKAEVALILESQRKLSQPCVEALYQLPSILSEEDLATYTQVCRESRSDLLARFHNDATFITSQCHILKTTVNPLLLDAENRITTCDKICKELEMEQKRLLEIASSRRTSADC